MNVRKQALEFKKTEKRETNCFSVGDLIKKSIKPCKEALKDAGLSTSDIDEP